MGKFLLIFLLVFLIGAVSALRINEIMYNPTPTTDAYNEWIEIYNNEDSDIDLNEWTINDKKINESLIIEPGDFVILARKLLEGTNDNPDSFESVWGNDDGVWDENDGGYLATEVKFSLPNSEKTLVLKDNDGELIFSITYSSDMGANGNGKSLQYCSGDLKENEPTPGDENECSSSGGSGTNNNSSTTNNNSSQTQNTNNNNNNEDETNSDEEDSKNSESKIYNKLSAEREEVSNTPIKLNTKNIKSSEANKTSGSVDYTKYLLVAFCVLLLFLYLIKPKSKKNEFKT